MSEQCCDLVRDPGRWPRFHQCHNKGVVERDGKWYCKQHDPVAQKSRNEASYAKFSEKVKAEVIERRYTNAAAQACRAAGLSVEALEAGIVEKLVNVLYASNVGCPTAEREAVLRYGENWRADLIRAAFAIITPQPKEATNEHAE